MLKRGEVGTTPYNTYNKSESKRGIANDCKGFGAFWGQKSDLQQTYNDLQRQQYMLHRVCIIKRSMK